jgi:hypothetical protein
MKNEPTPHAEAITAWINSIGERVGQNGFNYIAGQVEAQPRVVRKLAALGKLPSDWIDRLEAIGDFYDLPINRAWFIQRLAARPVRVSKDGVADARPLADPEAAS